MKLVGIVLVVIGIVGLAYGGITWTTREKVVDMGPVQISRDKTEAVPVPPIAGAVCLIAGVAILAAARRQT